MMKINLLATIILMNIISGIQAQKHFPDREAVMSGKFYPADSAALQRYLDIEMNQIILAPDDKRVRAIIAPHAGYSYSGNIAAHAFASLRDFPEYDNVFIIGSSHIEAFGGASVYPGGNYITPLGSCEINYEISSELRKDDLFNYPAHVHLEEHSIEVELPFLQHTLKNNFKIIPIILGTKNHTRLNSIAKALSPYFTENNLFVISTDLSHYPNYANAIKLDTKVIKSILTGSADSLRKAVKENEDSDTESYVTAICGYSAVYVLLRLTELSKQACSYQQIKYTNSGDISGDYSKVVGYTAISIREIPKQEEEKTASISFTEDEIEQMFNIARNSISNKFNKSTNQDIDNLGSNLKLKCGVFVSLYIDGKLRGCIGTFRQDKELHENIKEIAYASAFTDRRFAELSEEEFEELQIEISVLTPMQKINDISKIEIGKHGIYIKQGIFSGTYLPQVAIEQGWDAEEFVSHCSQHKANIGKDGWKSKDSELFIYESIIFKQ